MYKIALLGNPNSGKTTLYNILTKSRAKVGNWPGVTVDYIEGNYSYNNDKYVVVDLPGIYSLSPYSAEEIVTRNFLFDDSVDIILNIVDASNFERNLYLTTQLLEVGKKVVVALNMQDVLQKQGLSLDTKVLEEQLGCSVVSISAGNNEGIKELINTIEKVAKSDDSAKTSTILKESEIYDHITNLTHEFKISDFTACKLLEGDTLAKKEFSEKFSEKDYEFVAKEIDILKSEHDKSPDIYIADLRFNFIVDLYDKAISKKIDYTKDSQSDKLDKIFTNKYLGLPIFALLMGFVFYLTFGPFGSYLLDTADNLVNVELVSYVEQLLTSLGSSDFVISLITVGIIPGVGMVITFLPQILILFFFLSIFEDTGYMARIAFMMDGFLHKVGLSGKAFVPLITGFGCSVPAIMSTRTLDSARDRKIAIIITPFMSCGAKLPVYIVFAAAFFPGHETLAVVSFYMLGVVVALLSALLLKNTMFKGEEAPFILELPPYRLPKAKNVGLALWDKASGFFVRAGKILLPISIVIWLLQNFDTSLHMTANIQESMLASVGAFIAPIFTPLGFGNWESSVALLTGLVAKEVVVSTLSILYATGDAGLIDTLSAHFSTLSAISYLTFVVLYMPCVAALAAMKKEFNSWKYALSAVAYQTTTAYVVALLVYQIGSLFIS